MTWKQVEADDPRNWTVYETHEGILTSIPDPTTNGGYIVLEGAEGPITKVCSTKLYGPLSSIPIGTHVRIQCQGKIKRKGKPMAWEFKVWQED